MKYRPACLYLGLAVSVGGLCIFAAAWVVTEAYRKQRLALGASVYGEFDELCAELCPPEEAAFDAAMPKVGEDGTASAPQESGASDASDPGGGNETGLADGMGSAEGDTEPEDGRDGGTDSADVKDPADIGDTDAESADGKDDGTDGGNLI